MSLEQARIRRQQQVEKLCAASARAISGVADLHFRGRRLHHGRTPLPVFAPHLHPESESADFAVLRGAADAQALRLCSSDNALHARLRPQDPLEQVVFDLIEQLRVEALVPAQLPGVQRNLRLCFAAWTTAFCDAGLADTAAGILLFTVAQICRSRVTGDPVPEEIEDMMEATRAGIGSMLGAALLGLRRDRSHQQAYARHALHIARVVGELLRTAGAQVGRTRLNGASLAPAAFTLPEDTLGEPTDRFVTASFGRSQALDAAGARYKVFTRAYDRVRTPASLVRTPVLREYRQQLDASIAARGANVMRLARDLRQLLAHLRHDGWEGGQEEGLIDGRRLAQLVSTPRERRLFKTERPHEQVDCVVGFLIDCSGSMKEHAPTLAMLLDLFVRALELAGAHTEILGFTTGAWNGGRARRDWLQAGRPDQPGRLNELCHLVFKDADTRWRSARADIAALLKPDLFREGVDGEAVLWAHGRLQAREELRKLLVVVTDGSPMDSATQLTNDRHYLEHHLRDVAQQIQRQGDVEISALGVGLDLTPYYSRSHVLDLGDDSIHRMLREIAQLMLPRTRFGGSGVSRRYA